MSHSLATESVNRRRLWRWTAAGVAAATVLAPSEAHASTGSLDKSLADLINKRATRTRDAVLRLVQSRVDAFRTALPSLLGQQAASPASPLRTALDKVYGAWGEFPASAYGAAGDGVTDDAPALNAAAAAAAEAGGVVVLDKRNGTYLIQSQVTIPSFAGLRGYGSLNLNGGTKPISTIKLGTPDAAVVFGNKVLDSSHPGSTTFSPYAGKFDIDGNNTGQPAGALRFDGVNQIFAESIGITNAGGTACRVTGGQNGTYDQIVVHHSGRATSGDGFHISGGAGGNTFSRLYCRDTSADGAHLNVTKDPGIYDVYSNGPSHNLFQHCIFETVESTGWLARITDGGVNVFDSCLFAGPDTGKDAAKVLRSGAMVDIPGAPWVEFDSCHFVGVGHAMRIADAARVKVSGFSVFQTTRPLFKIDNCAPQLNLSQPSTYVINQPLVQLAGTGSAVNFTQDVVAQTTYRYSSETEPNATQITPWAIARYGDTQPRWFITRDGGMAWGPGGSVHPPQTLNRDAVYGMVFGGGVRVDGRVATKQPAVAFAGGTDTYTLDASAQKFHRYCFTNGGNPSFTIANPQPGSEVALQIILGSGSVPAVVWPADARFAENAPPALAPNTATTVTWRYDGDWSLWWEISRAAGVPVS